MRAKTVILVLILLLLSFPKVAFTVDTKELKFGFYEDKEVLSAFTFVLDDVVNRRINEIGNRVAKASDLPDIKYTFRIINDPTINAYATAGGFVYVNTGLLDILESEDELAVLLAHEIAHISKSHQIKFIRSAYQKVVFVRALSQAAAAAASEAIVGGIAPASSMTYHEQVVAHHLAGGVTGRLAASVSEPILIAMINGYSREQESEADALAIQYSSKAGYDPNIIIKFFAKLKSFRDRLKATEPNYLSSLINAEPGLEERIKQAEKLISKTK